MKQEMHDAIYTLVRKAAEYGDADSALKMAQAAAQLADAAVTIDDLQLEAAPEPAAGTPEELTPPADPVTTEDAVVI